MRRIITLLILIFTITGVSMAQQMSDDQVIQYVKQAQKEGKNQQQVTTELLKKGVTREQVERIKDKYEKQQSDGVVGKTVENKNDRQRKQTNSTYQVKTEGQQQKEGTEDNLGINFLYPDSITIPRVKWEQRQEAQRKEKIFGRDIFSNKSLSFEPNLNIATPVNYRLGPGDEVIIDVWGASQNTIRQTISPDGSIQVDNLGPVYLSGLTVKEANTFLQGEFSKIYSGVAGNDPNSQIKLTLGQIRTIQINIMGEVVSPGTYTLSSFASVFHALYQAGGVNKIGTLRAIKVYRNGKNIVTLDLYDYILNGKMEGDIRLTDNDVIVVGPYECLVDITGKVKRPMFYEMKRDESVGTLLKYAGDFTGDAYTKAVRLIRKSGREHQIYNVDEFDYKMFKVMDGDSIAVDSVLARFANRVEIKGAVYRPGMYQMDGRVNTLKALIEKAEGVRGDAFLNRAVLHREKEDFTLEVLSVDVKGLLNGTVADIPLRKNDVLYIPSIHDIKEEGTVSIHGEVSYPGVYRFADNMSLEDLVLQAGGLLDAASTVKVDVSRRVKNPKATATSNTIAKTFSFALKDGFVIDGQPGFILEAYDEVYVRKSPGYQKQQNVGIEGEVLFGGNYTLTHKNQRLTELIKQAGGLTDEAYSKGARLERRMTPEEKLRMETVLKMTAGIGKDSISTKTLDLGDTYYVGIELDKALANPGSDYDVVLREGDRIIVPQYVSTVKVNGAVMYPNTVTYQKGKKLRHYIDMAGGYGNRAKKSKAYVIYMNGTVDRLNSRNKDGVQPGCEIVVPTKADKKGLSLPEILSIGTSTASLATMIATIANVLK